MKLSLLVLVAGAVLLAGCSDGDRDTALSRGQEAWQTAKAKTGEALSFLGKEAERLTADSGRAALEAGRKQAVELQARLAELDVRNPLESAQLEAAKLQIEKLTAAMNLQDLKAQADQKLAEAQQQGAALSASVEEARRQLAEVDQSYRELMQRMDQAQRTYDQASSGLEGSLQRVQELTHTN